MVTRAPTADTATSGVPMKLSFDAEPLLAPLRRTGWTFYLAAVPLVGITLCGVFAGVWQLWYGPGTNGMGRPVYWGIYMVNFVAFTGISMAGVTVSALLRLARAEWRRPFTRCAELIAVVSIVFGIISVLIDVGRPDRLLNVFLYARPQSPIFWDINGLTSYLIVAVVYFFVRLIPDLAILRDRGVGWTWLYRLLALGYRRTRRQLAWLNMVSTVAAILLILFAVLEDSIISYIFATTLQPGWHSTIFGPYFVVGAIFSGLGALMVAMVIIRRVFHLESFITEAHFDKLGLLFLAVAGLMIYFTFNLYFVTITGGVPEEMAPVMENLRGAYAIDFWGMVGLGLILPALILAFPKGRKIPGLFLSGILVVVAMWVNRYITIMPTLNNPRLPWAHAIYHPTWVEFAVSAGCLALFILIMMVLTRFVPIVSMSEVQVGIDSVPGVTDRLQTYLPAGGLER